MSFFDKLLQRLSRLLGFEAPVEPPVHSDTPKDREAAVEDCSPEQEDLPASSGSSAGLGARARPPVRDGKGKEGWLSALEVTARETTHPVGKPSKIKKIAGNRRSGPIQPAPRPSNVTSSARSRKAATPPETTPPRPERRPEISVRIGIDFGTSFSKMAIGANGKVYLVDWTDLCQLDDPYLLPSAVIVDAADAVTIATSPRDPSVKSALKIPFIEGVAKPKDEELLIAYLAILMRYAREWLERRHKSWFASKTPRWEVNLGIPAGSWSEKPELYQVFQRLGFAAWDLSQCRLINLDSAKVFVEKSGLSKIPDGLEALNIVPEFCAQVAGYQNSPQRIEGMHLLIDIGGGTLDVVCFYVHSARSAYRESLAVYAASVDPYGTYFLTQRRLASIGRVSEHLSSNEKVPTAAEFAFRYSVDLAQVTGADNELQDKVTRLTHAALVDGRQQLGLGGGRVKVFISGGGASLSPYRCAVEAAIKKIEFIPSIDPLPEHANIEWAPDALRCAFDRVSVAAGLTEDLEMLKLFRPSEIPPVELPRRVERASHEEMYDD